MTAVLSIGALLVIGAVVGSVWGFADSLRRSRTLVGTAHAGAWGWVVLFAALMALFFSSGIGIAVIHAPYVLRTLDTVLFVATALSAVGCASLYVLTVRR